MKKYTIERSLTYSEEEKTVEVEITKEEAELALAHYAQPEGRFVPEEGDDYCYVDSYGGVSCNTWGNHGSDKWRLSQRNVFRTDEEAEDHREYLQAVAVIKESAEFWTPDWSDEKQYKWHGVYNHFSKILSSSNDSIFQRPNTIYFETTEALVKSQEEHLAEWKIYLNVKII